MSHEWTPREEEFLRETADALGVDLEDLETRVVETAISKAAISVDDDKIVLRIKCPSCRTRLLLELRAGGE